jgi:hypothetical protein
MTKMKWQVKRQWSMFMFYKHASIYKEGSFLPVSEPGFEPLSSRKWSTSKTSSERLH